MEEEIQKYIDLILDMEFADYKIDLCFTAVYYYLHNHPNNNAVEIVERYKMKEELQQAVKIYPEIGNITWDEFINNKTMYNAFNTIIFKAFYKWKERNWFGTTDTMIKDVESMMYVCDSSSVDFTERSSSARITSMEDLGFSMPLRGSSAPPLVVQGCSPRWGLPTEKPPL